MRVLVVDDSSTMRRIIKNTLTKAGFDDIDEAENGKLALEKVDGADLILTDWNMPEMDGLTFTKEARAKGVKVPIIMVTTESGKEEVVAAIQAGVNDYVAKPFTPETIKEKIDKALGR